MQPENFASTILILLILGVVFYAGYGWRIVVERRLHNMPWLKKSNRKAAAAAAKSTKRPVILPPVRLAEPVERQALPVLEAEALSTPLEIARDPPGSPTDQPTESVQEPPGSAEDVAESAAEPKGSTLEPAGDEGAAKPLLPRGGRRVLSLRRMLQSD